MSASTDPSFSPPNPISPLPIGSGDLFPPSGPRDGMIVDPSHPLFTSTHVQPTHPHIDPIAPPGVAPEPDVDTEDLPVRLTEDVPDWPRPPERAEKEMKEVYPGAEADVRRPEEVGKEGEVQPVKKGEGVRDWPGVIV
ncbi:uncharacterized protein SPPG_07162 [Spizellomyces punctatus DAOM BR117]|uniref:Uncharacterized protein n=1 Tax=Spizellomyces punctatus (strain DAOM BR117) TaxID=645134 RepID=A0A0L0H849_SPIPD|nr:uncharacterized protein SPPG_07162 [Spizellomyces punctatus DAOM BR117]KNC97700.1 hypothetical protein SPPG_07162 [Spizellomyces punctatus DAOM BR117]|eukprot:XP_016605740.1 hypothetical protein SPPG_07162 [Spizellomyces punctatus DAOM BR117]